MVTGSVVEGDAENTTRSKAKDGNSSAEIKEEVMVLEKRPVDENISSVVGEGSYKEVVIGSKDGGVSSSPPRSLNIGKGLSDTKFELDKELDEEFYQEDVLENVDPRCISQSVNILLGKAKGSRGRRSNRQKREESAKKKGIVSVFQFMRKDRGEVPKNGTFTWTNKRAKFAHISKRLDRHLICESWLESSFQVEALILPISLLDHFLVVLKLSEVSFKGSSSFKFLSMWWRNPEFITHLQKWSKNKIDKITDLEGKFHSSPEAIEEATIIFFKILLGDVVEQNLWSHLLADIIPKVILEDDNQTLGWPFSLDEVRKVVFDQHPNKAPGPNGFKWNFSRNVGDSWKMIYSESWKTLESKGSLSKR
ncbi:hypothetical protein SUGI_0048700 [Cryptomeria japonica]|nr:hypothetical protein SUGI_0048700 [Cryptomeria japonica]